jgi:1,2-dihydroxy-3-keto-5-methylthiopentene dioxygenase
MAILQLENGTTYQQINDINDELAPLNIQIQRWPVGENPQLSILLAQEQLDEKEKDLVLQHLDRYFQRLQATSGYQSRDLMFFHPQLPELDQLLAKFGRAHTHDNDEVRYVIAGEGIFGFVRPDDSQVELTVQAEEYINIPAGTEHWFYLTTDRTIKAVRYFIDTSGWTPAYTETPIIFQRIATNVLRRPA